MFQKQLEEFDQLIRKHPDGDLNSLFEKPIKGDARKRFSIYGTGYDVRTRESMEAVFKLLKTLMSEELWLGTGYDYVRQFRSQTYDLGEVGYGLPRFLKENGYDEEWIDIAEFEVNRDKSFHAFNKESELTEQTLAGISDETKFLFQPAVFSFESHWNIADSWLKKNDGPKLKKQKEFSLISRVNDETKIRIIEKSEFQVLSKLMAGQKLGKALQNIELKSTDLSQWLKHWIEDQVIYGLC